MYIFLEELKNDNDSRDRDFYHLFRLSDNELIGTKNSVEIVKFEKVIE